MDDLRTIEDFQDVELSREDLEEYFQLVAEMTANEGGIDDPRTESD